ncbi:MAG: hypothetical protein WDZ49_03895 [Litorilinea sp.]
MFLNTVLFLPAFLLNADATSFWPATQAESVHSFLFRLFIWRENLDVFRLNLELTWMIAATLLLAQVRRRFLHHVFLGLYLFIFIYYAYESAMLYLYRADPQFFSDYYLMRDGLGFLLENVDIATDTLVSAVAVIIGLLALLITGFRRTLHHITANQLNRISKILITAAAAASLFFAITYQTTLAQPTMVPSSAFFKLAENITASIATYQNLAQFEDVQIDDAYAYDQFTLAETPNLYLIFIESYGSVLYKRPDFRTQYAELAGITRRDLRENGWHMASALSEAPTWGGGSWLAYTSMLFGLRVENHPQYLTLLDKYALGDERYPHLGTYLQSQGYQFVWLSALAEQLSDRQWVRYNNFYEYDRLVRYPDLDYTGPHYGWGPSPPDQYSLGYTQANAIETHEGPSVLFFITQNSHFPWAPIPPVLEDWRAFLEMEEEDEPEPVDLIEHSALRARYMDSIVYSWEMLSEFIINQGDENGIYVIVGDHQPPRVSRRSDGFDTPVHVISRNPEFTASLAHYGFHRDTLFVRDEIPTLRHEGLYTLLVRHLIEHFGTDKTKLPEYYADGFSLYDYIEYVEEPENAASSTDTTDTDSTGTDMTDADTSVPDLPATGTPAAGQLAPVSSAPTAPLVGTEPPPAKNSGNTPPASQD